MSLKSSAITGSSPGSFSVWVDSRQREQHRSIKEERPAHLFAMLVAFNGDQAVVTCCHASEGVSDKVRLGVIVTPRQYVRDGNGVGRHQPAPAYEATIDKRRTVRSLPLPDEVSVLGVVHLAQVTHEERRRGRAGKEAEGRPRLADQESEKGRGHIEHDTGKQREQQKHE